MEGKRRRVVLVTCPLQGHINPMLQLGTILHSMGFSITVAHTQFNSPPRPFDNLDFVFLPFSNGLTDDDHKSSGDLIALLLALNTGCEVPLRDSLAQFLTEQQQQQQPCDEDGVVCIIYDSLMYCSQAVATYLKLPSIVLYTSAATNFLVNHLFRGLYEDGRVPLQDSMLQDLVPGHHPLRFKDLPLTNFGAFENFLKLIEILCNIEASSAMICNTMDFLEHSSLQRLQKLHKIPFFAVGPLQKIAPASSISLLEEDTSCMTWLEKQAPNSVLYVSLGSLASLDEKAFAEMAWGLANSNQPFLWVVRPGSVLGSEWIELLPETFEEEVKDRCKIVKWVPQTKVLAHCAVGGFWSHCGWNSTVESICEGVPVICWPCFGDQKVNARYLSDEWRVGVELEHVLERGKIERAVRRLMVAKEGEEMRQRAIELKEKADLCVRKGGSSYNSLNDVAEFIRSF